jgi:peroxiredoxin
MIMKRILFSLFTLGLLATIAPAAWAQTTAGTAIGQPAADFRLKDLEGKTQTLKDYRGKTAVLVFLSTQCPFSTAYYERISAIGTEYAARNVAVLGINSQTAESVEEIRAHSKQHNLAFPIVKDEQSRIADAYGATRTPEVFVIDPTGVLRYHGRVDNAKNPAQVKRNDLREALDEMLTGKPVSIAETKAFGCLIKMNRPAPKAHQAEDKAETEARPSDVSLPPYAYGFAPQKKATPARRTVAGVTPKVTLLTPADFAKFVSASKGQVLVINFWATWCGPCVAEFPEFVALDAKYKQRGVKIVGLSADDTTDLKTKVVPFLKAHKATFENYLQNTDDPQQMIDVVDKDWTGVLPATFVFDKQGKILLKKYGIIDRDEIVGVIESGIK